MWIDFEGIDGSGKTSVSTRVAQELRRRGVRVVHAREGGEFASRIAGRIRDFSRSLDCLFLVPEAELSLNLAREAQLVAEVVRPALAAGAWVISDRTAWSHLGLAHAVRGLSAAESHAAAQAACGGLWPDRVIVIDVDPDVARWRRRIRKIRERRLGDSGRKGLLGGALMRKTRASFLASARERSWPVVDNTWRGIEETVREVMELLEGGEVRPSSTPGVAFDPDRLSETYFEFAASLRDASVAAMLASGLEDPRADLIRRRAPADEAAFAVGGMNTPSAWSLRRSLKERSPYYVARGLAGLGGEAQAWALRRELEGAAPDQVLHSLAGEGGAEAYALRRRRWDAHPDEAVRSLKGLADSEAWALRLRARRDGGGDALAESLAGVDTPPSWELRSELRERHPVAVLRSAGGSRRPEAWELRQGLARVVPKPVLATIGGMADAEAEALRDALETVAPEETAASLAGIDTPASWERRRRLSEDAPAGVVKSLQGLPREKAEPACAELVRRHSGRLRVVREALQLRSMEPLGR